MLKRYKLDNKGTGHVFKRKKLFRSEVSKYQKIEIAEVNILGKILALDDIIQLSALDCDRYHETFAHVPMSNLENPTNALVIGGGDLILGKELLKYKNLNVDLVDIDERVIDLSKIYLSDLNEFCCKDTRLNIMCKDAAEFCSLAKPKTYDIIFCDITDPHPDSPSESLVAGDSIKRYKELLKPGGMIVCQTDNIQIAGAYHKNIKQTFEENFMHSGSFGIVALTLSSVFSFVWASDDIFISKKDIQVDTNWLNDKRFEFALNILELH